MGVAQRAGARNYPGRLAGRSEKMKQAIVPQPLRGRRDFAAIQPWLWITLLMIAYFALYSDILIVKALIANAVLS